MGGALVHLTFIGLLIACMFNPTGVKAQDTVRQCAWLLDNIAQSMTEFSARKQISLKRQYLTFCKNTPFFADDYTVHLGSLATALNNDSQHQEAFGVANQCLQINSADLSCLLEKANALYSLARVSEAKSIIEGSLTLGAITQIDAAAKDRLRNLLSQINKAADLAQYGTPTVAAGPSNHKSSFREVPLKKGSGTFFVPVEINGAITLEFAVDSGAADVSVPADVFSTLRRTGTIKDLDITGKQTYVLADGSKSQSTTFTIRSLKVGSNVIENVRASVAPATGTLLLGQSFLQRFKSWSIDNAKQALVLEPQ
jgi:clan AA aspartic protease (TIGR02281 family)